MRPDEIREKLDDPEMRKRGIAVMTEMFGDDTAELPDTQLAGMLGAISDEYNISYESVIEVLAANSDHEEVKIRLELTRVFKNICKREPTTAKELLPQYGSNLTDDHADVREHASEAVRYLSEQDSIPKSVEPEIIKKLFLCYRMSSDDTIEKNTTIATGYLFQQKTNIRAIRERLDNSSTSAELSSTLFIIRCYIHLDQESSQEGLVGDVVSLLEHEHAAVRKEACHVLAELEVESARNKLKELMEDPDGDVRAAAANAIEVIGHAEPDTVINHEGEGDIVTGNQNKQDVDKSVVDNSTKIDDSVINSSEVGVNETGSNNSPQTREMDNSTATRDESKETQDGPTAVNDAVIKDSNIGNDGPATVGDSVVQGSNIAGGPDNKQNQPQKNGPSNQHTTRQNKPRQPKSSGSNSDELVCPSCDTDVSPSDTFCLNCGTEL